MNPVDARGRSRRWFIACTVVIVVATCLAVVGIDLLTLPLFLAGALCSAQGHYWLGWKHSREEDE